MAAKPVVVGVDGSEGSLEAVEWAAKEAERRKAPLRIVTVAAMPPRMQSEAPPLPGEPTNVADELRGFSARALGAAVTRAEEVAPGLLIDTDLLTGAPADAITDSGSGAQLLVVGARGLGGFAALILGSVSRYVAAHASCPAIIVPTSGQADATEARGEIVVGVRDIRAATEAVEFAFEAAALRGAGLVVVHSEHGNDGGQGATAALTEALSGWRDKYPAVAVRPEIVHGHAGQALAERAGRADLVVIGRHGDESGGRHAIGSVPHTVLNHARGPVAVVPCAR
jgi:nucleotide-binding universal stress UspA family protein